MSTNDLTRRRFLGTAAAAAAGAAVTLPAQAASVANPAPAKWDIETDVVVLGCGGAGLMAACQAFDRGAKVEIFDKGMSPFHTGTNLCGGLFPRRPRISGRTDGYGKTAALGTAVS